MITANLIKLYRFHREQWLPREYRSKAYRRGIANAYRSRVCELKEPAGAVLMLILIQRHLDAIR